MMIVFMSVYFSEVRSAGTASVASGVSPAPTFGSSDCLTVFHKPAMTTAAPNAQPAQPEKIAPTIPPQGSTAYLNAAELTLAACVSVNCVTPQSVNPYRHASSKQSAIPMNHSAGLDSVRTILFRNEALLNPRAPGAP